MIRDEGLPRFLSGRTCRRYPDTTIQGMFFLQFALPCPPNVLKVLFNPPKILIIALINPLAFIGFNLGAQKADWRTVLSSNDSNPRTRAKISPDPVRPNYAVNEPPIHTTQEKWALTKRPKRLAETDYYSHHTGKGLIKLLWLRHSNQIRSK